MFNQPSLVHSLSDDSFRALKKGLTQPLGSLFGPNYVHQNALGQSGAELFKSTWHLEPLFFWGGEVMIEEVEWQGGGVCNRHEYTPEN